MQARVRAQWLAFLTAAILIPAVVAVVWWGPTWLVAAAGRRGRAACALRIFLAGRAPESAGVSLLDGLLRAGHIFSAVDGERGTVVRKWVIICG